MADTVFRSQSTATSEPGELDIKVGEPVVVEMVHDVETPYTDTQNFIEDYFGLRTEWKDVDATFAQDFEKIDGYIRDRISDGEIANSQQAVRELLKGMLKVNNLTKEERGVVKLEVLANYTEFLSKNDKLKSNLRRYGSA